MQPNKIISAGPPYENIQSLVSMRYSIVIHRLDRGIYLDTEQSNTFYGTVVS
jgi:hypothetical protein